MATGSLTNQFHGLKKRHLKDYWIKNVIKLLNQQQQQQQQQQQKNNNNNKKSKKTRT